MASLPPLLLFVASAVTVCALDPNKAPTQYVLDSWLIEKGLPRNTISAAVQTRDGYLWFGTEEGLVRFDGAQFTLYNLQNTPALKSDTIRALYEGSDGSLWIGTNGGGLSRLRDKLVTTMTTADGLASNDVTALYEDRLGRLWIGGRAGGISCYWHGQVTKYSQTDGLPQGAVYAICETPNGDLWVGTEGGLGRLRDGRFRILTAEDGLVGDKGLSLYVRRNGELWAGTNKGLCRLRGETFACFGTKDGLSNPVVFALSEDRDHNLWVGTWGGGLNRLRGGAFASLTSKNGLSNDIVLKILEDREGNLWVGTAYGMNRLRNGKVTTYTTAEGLTHDDVWSFGPAREGGVWIGTFDGWNLFRDGRIIAHPAQNFLKYSGVWSVQETAEGDLWLATNHDLYRLRDGKIAQRYTNKGGKDGLPQGYLQFVHETVAGDVWVGVYDGGLSRLHNGHFTTYTEKEGLPAGDVFTIHEAHTGDLWFGTAQGIVRWHDGTFITFAAERDAPRCAIRAIYQDEEGTLWFGSDSGGLYRLRDGMFTKYSARVGLYDDDVYAILEDDDHNLWMSSDTGVFRVSKAELNDYAAGKRQSVNSTIYDTADGMKSRECRMGHRTGWKADDGRLWFATTKGAVVVDPANLTRNDLPPPVIIEQVKADGLSYLSGGTTATKLSAGTGRIEFSYTALSFTAPERVTFRYKLEGFDENWVDAGARRVAYYTTLPPGPYTFRVAAANNDGVWNETGAALSFRLLPRFYQTYPFYLLCALLTGLAVWSLYRLRLRQMRERFALVAAERTRVAREMHDTLLQDTIGVAALLGAVATTRTSAPTQSDALLEQARDRLNETLGEARAAIWDLRQPTTDAGDLVATVSNTVQRLVEGTNLKVEATTHGTPRQFSREVAADILGITREAIFNSVKHAGAQRIRVELEFNPAFFQLSIADDGIGFDVKRVLEDAGRKVNDRHFGLVGMRERAARIGGQLTVHSSPGQGVHTTLRVPFERPSS